MLQYLDTIIALAVVMLGLSLLITLLNQMVSSFLSFRGSNLRWGIGTMLTTLDPTLLPHAREIANKILTDRVVSDSVLAGLKFEKLRKVPILGELITKWQLASAIGPDTLVRVLTKLSEGDAPYADDLKRLLNQVDPAAIRKLGMAYTAFGTPADAGGPSSPPAFPLGSPPDGQLATHPSYSVQMGELLAQLGNSAQQSVGRVEAWFNVAMNRVSQRFAMKIRIVTVIFAFLLAFGLHFDTLALTRQLFKDPVLRQKLVDSSGAMLSEASTILGGSTAANTAITASPEALQNAMKELLKNKDVLTDAKSETDLVAAVPPEFKSIDEAENWLWPFLKDLTPDRKARIDTKYKSLVILELKKQAQKLASSLKDAGIEFKSKPLPKWNGLRGWKELFGWPAFFMWDDKTNLAGILLTAALLSLGAPFWFNLLKQLTNLRPLVATKQDEQKKDAAH